LERNGHGVFRVVDLRVTLAGVERVAPLRDAEGLGQDARRVVVVLGVVPAGQRPRVIADVVLDDALERSKVDPVPRKEEPAVVPAAAPQHGMRERGLKPGEAVDGRLEAPAQGILRVAGAVVALAHRLDATRVVLEDLSPAVAPGRQGLDIAPNPGRHSGDPNHYARPHGALERATGLRWYHALELAAGR
jgi:hypothetical protein